MTDHLEEARGYIRANTATGFIIPDRVEASVAIVHALIAIAERLEPQTVDVEECGHRFDDGIGGTHFCAREASHRMPHRSVEGVEWFPVGQSDGPVAS